MAAQAMWIEQALGLLHLGISTNWWGLGCPSHCQGSLLVVGLCWASGFLLGVVLTLVFFREALFAVPIRVPSSPPQPSSSPPTRAADLRLRAYLHER